MASRLDVKTAGGGVPKEGGGSAESPEAHRSNLLLLGRFNVANAVEARYPGDVAQIDLETDGFDTQASKDRQNATTYVAAAIGGAVRNQSSQSPELN